MIWIGIDPDVEKSGVACYESSSRKLNLSNLTFFQLFDYLKAMKDSSDAVKVVIESGWENKSNWHVPGVQSNAISARIGAKTGANHETGKKIVEMCAYLGLDCELKRPDKRTAKINSAYFAKLTGIKRSNQEVRDAAMLVWGR